MEGNKNNVCQVCGSGNGRCGSCGNMCGFGGYHILRWVLGVLIITWVFSLGMRFGELKASLDQYGYGYGNHMRVMPMMGGAGWAQENVVYSTSATPVSSTGGTVQIKK